MGVFTVGLIIHTLKTSEFVKLERVCLWRTRARTSRLAIATGVA